MIERRAAILKLTAVYLCFVVFRWIFSQGLVVQRADNSIQRINHYPVDSVLCSACFRIIYPLDSDLSAG